MHMCTHLTNMAWAFGPSLVTAFHVAWITRSTILGHTSLPMAIAYAAVVLASVTAAIVYAGTRRHRHRACRTTIVLNQTLMHCGTLYTGCIAGLSAWTAYGVRSGDAAADLGIAGLIMALALGFPLIAIVVLEFAPHAACCRDAEDAEGDKD